MSVYIARNGRYAELLKLGVEKGYYVWTTGAVCRAERRSLPFWSSALNPRESMRRSPRVFDLLTKLFYFAAEADLSGQPSSEPQKGLASCDVGRRKDAGEFTAGRNAFEATVFKGKDEMAQRNYWRDAWPPLDNKARCQDFICTVWTQAFCMQDVLNQLLVVGGAEALEDGAIEPDNTKRFLVLNEGSIPAQVGR